MTTHYVDPAASGSNNGTSWTNAWTSLQSAVDNVSTPADIVYCRGTQTLSTAIAITVGEGTVTGGMIRYIGCNSSGNVDGTRFVLDGNSSATNCMSNNSMDYLSFENFEFKNATGDGVLGVSTASYGFFYNCSFHHNGSYGFDGNYWRLVYFFRCTFYNNNVGAHRVLLPFFFCSFHTNTSYGFNPNGVDHHMVGCLFYNNNIGVNNVRGSFLYSCVFNDNTTGGLLRSTNDVLSVIIGNRFTNHSAASEYGMDANSRVLIYGWNYFEDNTNNLSNSSVAIAIDIEADTNIFDQADTNEGYTTAGSDFNLRSDASLRRTAISIPTT